MSQPQAILVLPHLRIQNANAISSPLTHGFPSITAFTGVMWALERKLVKAGVPLQLHGVGVVCHHHQEQVSKGYVRNFNLTRNPVDKDGSTPAIVEEGRMHLEVTLVFAVSQRADHPGPALLIDGNGTQMADWAQLAGDTIAGMRVAGGSVLPSRPVPGIRVRPWMSVVPEDSVAATEAFRRWRRSWLPGFALVGRDDLLADRLQELRANQPNATVLDAWLHISRFNHQPQPLPDGTIGPDGQVIWRDPWRAKGSGWVVPIPVGYAALTPTLAPGSVRNARDATVPVRFVESIYSVGEWLGPHRLTSLGQLLWHPESDEALGVYRCRSGYQRATTEDMGEDWDDLDAYD
ncbi:MAG: type I-F CRISPR-associated protein Csy2 [Aquabacterium sp.]